ncbi:phosphopantetheine-binding protein [Desulfosarcina sp. OttesenSCG-928-A07]|nr:phosphopantetheine-binding protein [Desulfosarcina sp. OttesenSCG-928-G17]MDL2328580.1 phosphopantetheine-binding protein [Desulfosarcina sp. OttesenSCG-928-A07]
MPHKSEPSMEALLNELRTKIIDILNLPGITPADIREDDPLVGGPLGIDSIDVLEMVIMVEKDYHIVINNKELGAKVFATLRTLADYIRTHTPEAAS